MSKGLSAYIDLLRFGAALLVLFGHVQLQVQASALLALLGSLAHQGVIVFFVVSGYLVGGKLLNSTITRRFLAQYAVDRASRIYPVTVPAILLGLAVVAVLDALYGRHYSLSDPCRATATDFFASLVFLHEGIWAGPCGNRPFWSLIFEVYYYVLAALGVAALCLQSRCRWMFAGAAAAALAYGLFEPTGMIFYGAVWLLGAAVAQRAWGLRAKAIAAIAVIGVLMLPLVIEKEVAKYDTLGSLLVAGSLLLAARVNYLPPAALARFFAWGAGFSFSLYLAHAPMLSVLGTVTNYQPNGSARAYVALTLSSLLFAYLFYLAFERRTPAIRAYLTARLVTRPEPFPTDLAFVRRGVDEVGKGRAP